MYLEGRGLYSAVRMMNSVLSKLAFTEKEGIKMSEKKILDVVKVGFNGNTGDDRSPEDFAFPTCMTSLMQYFGEDYPILEIEAHNRKYTMRTANLHFMTASGMALVCCGTENIA